MNLGITIAIAYLTLYCARELYLRQRGLYNVHIYVDRIHMLNYRTNFIPNKGECIFLHNKREAYIVDQKVIAHYDNGESIHLTCIPIEYDNHYPTTPTTSK